MKRREFFALFVGVVSWPFAARAQTAATQAADDALGQVATLQGSAMVTRGKAAAAALKVSDAIYKKDVLQTGANGSLGVTFDDETTLSLSANARIVVDEFVYETGAKGNKAVFNIARGTVAFVASLVAKSGDMPITTPTSTLGIRGTTESMCRAAPRLVARAKRRSSSTPTPTGAWAASMSSAGRASGSAS